MPAPQPFVWDASSLHHAIKADRADVLIDLADHGLSIVARHITTAAVVEELGNHGLAVPAVIDTVNVDGLNELIKLVKWVGLMSTSVHNRGEATVCAWADVHAGIVVMDDRRARKVATAGGLQVLGTLRITAEAVVSGHIPEVAASSLIDELIRVGARYPHGIGGFSVWARSQGLLT